MKSCCLRNDLEIEKNDEKDENLEKLPGETSKFAQNPTTLPSSN
jgi:hypothetical protein